MLDNFRKVGVVWNHSTNRIYQPMRVASSDDRGRKLVVQITNDSALENTQEVELRLYWEIRDKKGFNDFVLIDAEHGIYEIYFSRGMLENKGTHKAWLHATDTTGSITSETFGIEVFSGIDLEAVEGTDDFSALNSALVRVVEIESQEEERQTNETARKQAESARATAENTRKSAEDTRKNNEGERKTAENARESAETARESAESTRQSNETSRQNAESIRQETFEGNEVNRQSEFEENENTRQSNEQTRQTQETARQTNETNRQSEFEDMKGQVDNLEETYAPRLSAAEQNVSKNHHEVTAQLAQKATYQTVFGMSNLSQEVKNAITGGSVAVVGENAVSKVNIAAGAVTPTETDFIVRNVVSDTLVDDTNIQTGIYYEWNTGNIVERSDYNSTGLIPCVPNAAYTRNFERGQVTFWDKNADHVSGLSMIANIIVVPDDASIAYMRVAHPASVTNFTVNKGETLLPKDAYREEYDFSLPLEIRRELTEVKTITSDLSKLTAKKTMSYHDDYSYSEYRSEDTTFWTTHIHQNKFDGTVNYPKVRLTAEHIDDPNTQSVQQYVAGNQHDLVINGGIFNINTDITDGYLIIDGEIIQDKLSTTHMYQHTLGVMQDGTLRSFEDSVSPTELLAQGVQQAVVGFIPIIIDGEIPSDDFLKICPHSKIKNPRQVIGQYPNGDYIIFSCDGRKEGEAGMTLREAAEIMQKLGVSFAYNLDGGGSTQTYMGKKIINAPLENRRVPNVLVF